MPETIPDEPARTETPGATDAQALLSFAANRDVSCPSCGYNLRMLNKPICPECGLALKLTVGSDVSFKRIWAITLIINSLVAGIGLLFAMLFAFNSDFREYVGERSLDLLEPRELFFLMGWLGPILWVPVPLLLMWQRRWFCRINSKAQYILLLVSIVCLLFLGFATFRIFN